MREPMNRSTTTIRSISSRYGASFGFGRGGRWYFGGPSRLSAKRTVLRATPSSAAIALMDLPCACKYRIVVHPSTVSISSSRAPRRRRAEGDAAAPGGELSGDEGVRFRFWRRSWDQRAGVVVAGRSGGAHAGAQER